MYKLRVSPLCAFSSTKWGTSKYFVTVEEWQKGRLKKCHGSWKRQPEKSHRKTQRQDRKGEEEKKFPPKIEKEQEEKHGE